MEKVCWGQMDLTDLCLEHLCRLLAEALRPLGVVVPQVDPVTSAPARAIDDDKEEEEDDDKEDEA
jgi:hypothetical protein